jgi:hypothetical protein
MVLVMVLLMVLVPLLLVPLLVPLVPLLVPLVPLLVLLSLLTAAQPVAALAWRCLRIMISRNGILGRCFPSDMCVLYPTCALRRAQVVR